MNLEIGTKYIMDEDLKVLCCSCVLKSKELVSVWGQPSKNRLIIIRSDGTLHKVKRSSLNRTAKEVFNVK